jgi:hypothetical protein
MSMELRWNAIGREKPKNWEKPCPIVTLSTTNLTWTEPEANPGFRGGKPATNRLSCGTAISSVTISYCYT